MLGMIIAFAAGLFVGWNFIPQPAWLKKKLELIIKR